MDVVCALQKRSLHCLKLTCVFCLGKTEWESATREAGSRPTGCRMVGGLTSDTSASRAVVCKPLTFSYDNLNRAKQHVPYLSACHLPTGGYLGREGQCYAQGLQLWGSICVQFFLFFLFRIGDLNQGARSSPASALTIVQHPWSYSQFFGVSDQK